MPAGYLAAEFLESTGTQYIDTKQLPTITTEFELDCYYNTPVSNVIGYTEPGQCIFGMRISTSLRGYAWRYMVSNYNVNGRGYASFGADRRIASTLAGLNHYRFSYKNSVFSVNEESSVVDISGDAPLEDITLDWSLFLFKGNYVDETYDDPARGRVFKLKIWRDSSLKTSFEPTLDQQGVPCMFDKVSKQPFYNKGTGSFIVGFTLPQARKLSALPATGGTLKVSLPTGYEADEGVMNALETARSNGWTLTVQTYTPENGIMTTDLFDIWVRKTQDENGQYIDSDGTRWFVDWCNCMYTHDGSTERDHGYESHPSVEEACTTWGLTPYVDPEAENLLTEYNENEQ